MWGLHKWSCKAEWSSQCAADQFNPRVRTSQAQPRFKSPSPVWVSLHRSSHSSSSCPSKAMYCQPIQFYSHYVLGPYLEAYEPCESVYAGLYLKEDIFSKEVEANVLGWCRDTGYLKTELCRLYIQFVSLYLYFNLCFIDLVSSVCKSTFQLITEVLRPTINHASFCLNYNSVCCFMLFLAYFFST